MISACHARILTSQGRGAVAVVEMVAPSPDAAACVFRAVFSAGTGIEPSAAPINRIVFGRWKSEEVVVVRTEPLRWEISCHGGVVAVQSIVSDILRCSLSDSPRSSENLQQDSDPLEQQILEVLKATRTLKTARYVLAQCQVLPGLFRNLMVAPSDPEVQEQVRQLQAHRRFAEHLVHPWRVLIVGPPNAGKSSIVNAILGRERAIVFDQPGTTRDLIEAETWIEEWPFLFVDSAGLRHNAADEIERLGIESVHRAVTLADAVLLVHDITEPHADKPETDLAIPAGIPVARLRNKCDLALTQPGSQEPGEFFVSAHTGQGIPDVMKWLVKELIGTPPRVGTPLPVTEELCRVLDAHGPASA
ncbi:MAG: 50S ribosome-binding GTPase [Planctomycetaceae bacterium]|nr:50S ribosome-binding GTPase [Planctomycetaceae bacterium]